jgi:hypothetical protein
MVSMGIAREIKWGLVCLQCVAQIFFKRIPREQIQSLLLIE